MNQDLAWMRSSTAAVHRHQRRRRPIPSTCPMPTRLTGRLSSTGFAYLKSKKHLKLLEKISFVFQRIISIILMFLDKII
jgi:hypothetical protein